MFKGQVWRSLFGRSVRALRAMARTRPLRALLGLLLVTTTGILAVMGGQAYRNRDWRAISGGQALLGEAGDWCSQPVAPFEIQVTEVSNAAYLECVRAGECPPPQSIWEAGPTGWVYPDGMAQHPVFGLSWEAADAYCRFIGARLPTEAEWVRAARGGSRQDYPWGDTFDAEKANTFESNIGGTVAVKTYPDGRNAMGLYHLSGNVREWVAGQAIAPCDFTQGEGAHIARGGSFLDRADHATLWSRFQGDDLPYTGMRCARDLPP
ncbi:MAG: hypothetical protein D6796_11980 [Caldilineae bacterium]|nr:MAG: hypothetical protein D6796_11980 [Caldilineae bacterium]